MTQSVKYVILFCVTLVSINGFGQINYQSSNDTIIFDLDERQVDTAYIDVNNDGVHDFKFASGGNYILRCDGLGDSNIIAHSYYETAFPLWGVSNMTDSVINEELDWSPYSLNLRGGYIYREPSPDFNPVLQNTTGYLGFRMFIEGNDFIAYPHYGWFKVTRTLSGLFIVRGWAYQETAQTEILASDVISSLELELNDESLLEVEYFDFNGVEISKRFNEPILVKYSDGTVKRVVFEK